MKNQKSLWYILLFWGISISIVIFLASSDSLARASSSTILVNSALVIYGIFALFHIFIQVFFAHSEFIRKKRKYYNTKREKGDKGADESNFESPVSIIIPAYNETPSILYDCIESCRNQLIADLEVIVIDDGSTNLKKLN